MRLVLVGLLLLIVPLGGCQTSVSVLVEDEDLARPAAPANLKVTLLSKARDIRDKPRDQVGRHFFLFMPGPQVKPEEGRLDHAIAKNMKAVLEVSGYSVSTVDRLRDATGPVVVVQIDDLRNNLFIFPYPLATGWGRMRLSVHVLTPEGKELWAGATEGHWGVMASLFYMCGFELRVQSDLKSNLNQIMTMVSSEEFKKQIRP